MTFTKRVEVRRSNDLHRASEEAEAARKQAERGGAYPIDLNSLGYCRVSEAFANSTLLLLALCRHKTGSPPDPVSTLANQLPK